MQELFQFQNLVQKILRENIEICDIQLADADILELDKFDRGFRIFIYYQ